MRTLTRLLEIRTVISWIVEPYITKKVEVTLVAVGYPQAIFLNLVIPEQLLFFRFQYKNCLCCSHVVSRKPAGNQQERVKIPQKFRFFLYYWPCWCFLCSDLVWLLGMHPDSPSGRRQKVPFIDWKLELQSWDHLAGRCFCSSGSIIIFFLLLIPTLGSAWHWCEMGGGNPQKMKTV